MRTCRRSRTQREAGSRHVPRVSPIMASWFRDPGWPWSREEQGRAQSASKTATQNAICQHQRVHAVLSRLQRSLPARSVWTPAGLAVRSALWLLHPVERLTWRRLISCRAVSAEEASEKTLYIIALTMAHQKTLQLQDVLIATESVKDFRYQLSRTLQARRDGHSGDS